MLLFSTLCLLPLVVSQQLSDSQIGQVRARLADSAEKSWELGTRTQVLLELDTPSLSVFSKNQLPPPTFNPPSSASAVFNITSNVLGDRSRGNNGAQGAQPLMADGSATDPASIGVAVLLANWTGQAGQNYAGAAKDQLDYLLYNVPRSRDGAISHRVSEVQLWSDFVYMVPPFLAYYGVLANNQTLVQEAYNQIKLYRNNLRDKLAGNLWRHIVVGSEPDPGHWSTGNAWAAAGILRVLATIQYSPFADSMKSQRRDLVNWAKEIHDGMYRRLDSTNIFPNYASNDAHSSGNFYDAASTALLASTVYRLASLASVHTHLPQAERCRQTLSTSTHIDEQGWLSPVVDPYSFGQQGQHSPEGQAFVLAMHAAWRDWVAEGSPGANAAMGLGPSGWWYTLTIALAATFLVQSIL